MLYRITFSPDAGDEDESLPWDYEEAALIGWVDEVFLEGYKKSEDAPFPSLDECLEILEGAGYEFELVATQ